MTVSTRWVTRLFLAVIPRLNPLNKDMVMAFTFNHTPNGMLFLHLFLDMKIYMQRHELIKKMRAVELNNLCSIVKIQGM